MNIGIITVLFKSDMVIDGFISSLNSQTTQNFTVCFIDNDTGDFCKNKIETNAKFKYVYQRNEVNVGVAKANNQGIDYFSEKVKVEFILFLNNDTEFKEDFLQKHMSLFQNGDDIQCIAPLILYYENRQVWYAGGKISYIKSSVRHFGHNKKEKFGRSGIYKVDYAPTCSLMIKASELESSKIRMLDKLFVYFDDLEFCKDLKKNKIVISYVPEIELLHKVSTSTGGTQSDFSRYYLARNKYYLMRKHKSLMLLLLPIIFMIRVVLGQKIENKGIVDSFKMSLK